MRASFARAAWRFCSRIDLAGSHRWLGPRFFAPHVGHMDFEGIAAGSPRSLKKACPEATRGSVAKRQENGQIGAPLCRGLPLGADRAHGLVGYDIPLTWGRSPVRIWVSPLGPSRALVSERATRALTRIRKIGRLDQLVDHSLGMGEAASSNLAASTLSQPWHGRTPNAAALVGASAAAAASERPRVRISQRPLFSRASAQRCRALERPRVQVSQHPLFRTLILRGSPARPTSTSD